MNIRVLAATVLGAVTIFLLGYLFFGILLAPYTTAGEIPYAGLRKAPPDMLLLVLKISFRHSYSSTFLSIWQESGHFSAV